MTQLEEEKRKLMVELKEAITPVEDEKLFLMAELEKEKQEGAKEENWKKTFCLRSKYTKLRPGK